MRPLPFASRSKASADGLGRQLQKAATEAQTALTMADPVQAVHQARVGLKRVRALARLGCAAHPKEARALNAAARAAMAPLSAARDLAALEAAALRVAPKRSDAVRAALLHAAAHLAQRRAGLEAPSRAEAARQIAAVLDLAKAWPATSAKDIARGAKALLKKAAQAHKAAVAAAEAEPRHTWRKREKDRLHAMDLLDRRWPQDLPRDRRRVRHLAAMLGDERDLLLLIDHLTAHPEAAGGPGAAALALAHLNKRRIALGERADALGATIYARA
jgi:hypothetical protein